MSTPICEQCHKRPATCSGEYETCTGVDHYACDECCGHGNEDGHCDPIKCRSCGANPCADWCGAEEYA